MQRAAWQSARWWSGGCRAQRRKTEVTRRVEHAGYQPIAMGLHLVDVEALDEDVLRAEFSRLEALIEEFGGLSRRRLRHPQGRGGGSRWSVAPDHAIEGVVTFVEHPHVRACHEHVHQRDVVRRHAFLLRQNSCTVSSRPPMHREPAHETTRAWTLKSRVVCQPLRGPIPLRLCLAIEGFSALRSPLERGHRWWLLTPGRQPCRGRLSEPLSAAGKGAEGGTDSASSPTVGAPVVATHTGRVGGPARWE